MCASFHRYGDAFFPGTGAASDVGERRGRGYSVNIPLREGVDDATFHAAFKPVMARVLDVFRPGAIVLQCGADSLGGDRLGCFNLTVAGHAEAVRYIQSFGLPTLVTGGGGYTKSAVARCWAAETAVLTGVGLAGLPDALPPHPYLEYFAPSLALGAHRPAARWLENGNARADVERLVREATARLAELEAAPGVQMGAVPPDALIPEWGGAAPGGKGWGQADDDAAAAADERLGAYGMRHLVVRDPEGGDDGATFY
jgi:histone deacetylase 1/2